MFFFVSYFSFGEYIYVYLLKKIMISGVKLVQEIFKKDLLTSTNPPYRENKYEENKNTYLTRRCHLL